MSETFLSCDLTKQSAPKALSQDIIGTKLCKEHWHKKSHIIGQPWKLQELDMIWQSQIKDSAQNYLHLFHYLSKKWPGGPGPRAITTTFGPNIVCRFGCQSCFWKPVFASKTANFKLFITKIATQTGTILRGVWNLPHKYHLYLINNLIYLTQSIQLALHLQDVAFSYLQMWHG